MLVRIGEPINQNNYSDNLLNDLKERASSINKIKEESSFKDSLDFEKIWGISSLESKESMAERFLTISIGEFLDDYAKLNAKNPESAQNYLNSITDPNKVHISELDRNSDNVMISLVRRKLANEYNIKLPDEQIQQYILKRYIYDYDQHIKNSPHGVLSNLINFFPDQIGEIIGSFNRDFPYSGLGKIATFGSMVYAGGLGFRLGQMVGSSILTKPLIQSAFGKFIPLATGIGVESYTLGVPDILLNKFMINPIRKDIGLPELGEPDYFDNLLNVGSLRGIGSLIKFGVSSEVLRTGLEKFKSFKNENEIFKSMNKFVNKSSEILESVYDKLTPTLIPETKRLIKSVSVFLNRIFSMFGDRNRVSHHESFYTNDTDAKDNNTKLDSDIVREIDAFENSFSSLINNLRESKLPENDKEILSRLNSLRSYVTLMKNSIKTHESTPDIDKTKYKPSVIRAHEDLVDTIKKLTLKYNQNNKEPLNVIKDLYSNKSVRKKYNRYLSHDNSVHINDNHMYKNTLFQILHNLNYDVKDYYDDILNDRIPNFDNLNIHELNDIINNIIDIPNVEDAK
ncbi:MAG: hypothetical protein ACRCX2_01130 [Paraclostridium sp.]